MPRFEIEVTETIVVKATICITAGSEAAAKKKLESAKDDFRSFSGERDVDDYERAKIIGREINKIKKLPSKAEAAALEKEANRRMDAMEDKIWDYIGRQSRYKDEHGQRQPEILVQFAAYEYEDEDRDLPDVSTLDKVPVEGRVVVYDEDTNYISPVMNDPTWLQLCHIANEIILRSGDTDHVFLESVEAAERARDVPSWVTHKVPNPYKNINFCTFGMGS